MSEEPEFSTDQDVFHSEWYKKAWSDPDCLPVWWPDQLLDILDAHGVYTWAHLDAVEPEQFLSWKGSTPRKLAWLRTLIRDTERGTTPPPTEMTVEALIRWSSIDPNLKRCGVYFLKCDPFIKIGRAVDVRKRCVHIGQVVPYPCHPIGWIPMPQLRTANLEKALHEKFAAYRLRRRSEWFHEHEDLLAFIREHAKPWPTKDREAR